MNQDPKWVIDPRQEPMWQAPDASRKLNLLIGPAQCGAEHFAAGTFHLAPGCETMPDIHPDATAALWSPDAGRARGRTTAVR